MSTWYCWTLADCFILVILDKISPKICVKHQDRGIVTTDLFLTERLYKITLGACIFYLYNVLKHNA